MLEPKQPLRCMKTGKLWNDNGNYMAKAQPGNVGYMKNKIYVRVAGSNAIQLVEDKAYERRVDKAETEHDRTQEYLADMIDRVKHAKHDVHELREGIAETQEVWDKGHREFHNEMVRLDDEYDKYVLNEKLQAKADAMMAKSGQKPHTPAK